MQHIAVRASLRPEGGTKADLKRRRRQGQIPANLFGRGADTRQLLVSASDLIKVMQAEGGVNTLIDLALDAERHLVQLTNVEMDPITRTFRHVGLHKISANEPTTASVPVELVGEPEAVRHSLGVLEPGLTHVDVRSLPDQIPNAFLLDVSAMEIGDVKHVSDLTVPGSVEVLTQPDQALVSLHVSRADVQDVQQSIDQASAEASPSPDAANIASNE